MTDIESIIEGCKNKDAEAIKALYTAFAPKLYGICIRYARTNFEAEDILQDGFIKIIKSFPGFQGNKHNLESWLRKIILFTSIDHFKLNLPLKHQIDIADVQEECGDCSYQDIEAGLNSEDLVAIINKLPVGYKVVFNLYVVEGFSHREIASMLGISEGTSKSQLSKAKKFLKVLLTKQQLFEKTIKYGE